LLRACSRSSADIVADNLLPSLRMFTSGHRWPGPDDVFANESAGSPLLFMQRIGH
jgi:hypothetical protein